MVALDHLTANRLAKICGLLSSSHDGERASAARKASEILRSNGVSWSDVFAPALPAPPPRPQPAYNSTQPAHVMNTVWALQFSHRLTSWEHDFLESLGRQQRLSAKRSTVLSGIIARLRQAGAG
jgi:hypothetical protein